jgi:excisionase family DNA binding protein
MDDILTTEEAASILGVSARRVRQMIQAGELPAKTVGTGTHSVHLIARADLKLVKNRKSPGRPEGSKNKKPPKKKGPTNGK